MNYKLNVITENEELFCYTYARFLGVLNNLRTEEIKVLGECLRYTKGKNFKLDKAFKIKTSVYGDVDMGYIVNAILHLKFLGILTEIKDKIYKVSDKYVVIENNGCIDTRIRIDLKCENNSK